MKVPQHHLPTTGSVHSARLSNPTLQSQGENLAMRDTGAPENADIPQMGLEYNY